jgi:hypothetical protein
MENKSPTPNSNQMENEQEILNAIAREITRSIPKDFGIQFDMITSQLKSQALDDFQLSLKFIEGEISSFSGQLTKSLNTTGVYKVIAEAQKKVAEGIKPMVAARYISEPAKQALRDASISFADATGNIMLLDKESRLRWSSDGLKNDPWRKAGRPTLSLKGISTQLVVKTLLDLQEPYEMSKLIELSGTSRGSAYRTLDLLEAEGFVARDGKKKILSVEWEKLAMAWAQESSFSESSKVYSFVAPRGLDHVLELLRKRGVDDYAITGTFAASKYQPSTGLYTLMLYTANVANLANELGLKETKSGANVLIAHPNSTGPINTYQFSKDSDVYKFDGLQIVSMPQAYRDLATGPGRNPEEAKNLLRWMVSNVEVWRKRP